MPRMSSARISHEMIGGMSAARRDRPGASNASRFTTSIPKETIRRLYESVPCGIGGNGSGPGARGHLGGPRQGLRVDILLDVRHFAISNGNVEDPLVLVRLIRSIDFSRSDADDQNPVSLRHEFGGLWVFHFHLFGRL